MACFPCETHAAGAGLASDFLSNFLRGLLELPEAVMPLVAWGVLVAWLFFQGWRLVRAAPQDAAILLGAVLVALLARLALPWGPLDFAEPERFGALWTRSFVPYPDRISVALPTALGRLAGLDPLTFYRWTGPLCGALGVGATYLLARAASLSRLVALLAAAIVCAAPAHLRYSGSGNSTVIGSALWCVAFAVALSSEERLGRTWRVALLVALLVIGVEARPEYRLLPLALAPLLLGSAWNWGDRIAVVLVSAVAFLPYVRQLAPTFERNPLVLSYLWGYVQQLLGAASIGHVWWAAAGFLGLLVSRLTWRVRLSFGLAVSLLMLAYALFSGERNSLFGSWRYFLSFFPFLALLAAGLVARLTDVRAPRLAPAILTGATLLSALAYLHLLTRPVDLQAQFQFLVSTAREMVEGHGHVAIAGPDYVTTNDPQFHGLRPTQQMGIALAQAVPDDFDLGCRPNIPASGPALWSVDAALGGCPHAPPSDRVAIFLGLYRDQAYLDAALKGRHLQPIREQVIPAALTTPSHNTQCAERFHGIEGDALADCPVTLGWYKVVP